VDLNFKKRTQMNAISIANKNFLRIFSKLTKSKISKNVLIIFSNFINFIFNKLIFKGIILVVDR